MAPDTFLLPIDWEVFTAKHAKAKLRAAIDAGVEAAGRIYSYPVWQRYAIDDSDVIETSRDYDEFRTTIEDDALRRRIDRLMALLTWNVEESRLEEYAPPIDHEPFDPLDAAIEVPPKDTVRVLLNPDSVKDLLAEWNAIGEQPFGNKKRNRLVTFHKDAGELIAEAAEHGFGLIHYRTSRKKVP